MDPVVHMRKKMKVQDILKFNSASIHETIDSISRIKDADIEIVYAAQALRNKNVDSKIWNDFVTRFKDEYDIWCNDDDRDDKLKYVPTPTPPPSEK